MPRSTPSANHQRAARDVDSVVPPANTHREGQLAGAGSEIFHASRRGASPAHFIDASHRFQRTNEYASGLALRLSHEVQALVHSVNEVDVGVAGRAEKHLRPIGNAAPGVGRAVVHAEVGFGLYNPAGYDLASASLGSCRFSSRDISLGSRLSCASGVVARVALVEIVCGWAEGPP